MKFVKIVGQNRTWALVLIVLCVLNGCAQIKKILGKGDVRKKEIKIESIEIYTTHEANEQTALAVDVLFVYNEFLGKELLEKKARDWFQERGSYQLKFQKDLEVVSREMVPAAQARLDPLPKKHKKALYVIVFANYFAAVGQSACDIAMFRHAVILFEKSEYKIFESKMFFQPRTFF